MTASPADPTATVDDEGLLVLEPEAWEVAARELAGSRDDESLREALRRAAFALIGSREVDWVEGPEAAVPAARSLHRLPAIDPPVALVVSNDLGTDRSQALTSLAALAAPAFAARRDRIELARKTAELEARVADLEDTRMVMTNMMAEALENQEKLQAATHLLEDTVASRTRELVLAKEAAERADRLKSKFLGRVSHELRTPMHGIMSFARLGIRKIESSSREKNRQYFQQVLDAANELLPLINDLLDVSRIDEGKVAYDFARNDVGVLVGDILGMFDAMLQERSLRLETQVALAPGDEAVFDKTTMRQVLVNLVGNASKFAPPGSAISVSARFEDAGVVVEVADRGPGVPREEQERIFEAFQQSSLTKQGYEGTGLGLAIARGIARDHGGDIEYRDREGGGAVFRLHWPIAGPEAEAETPRETT